MERFLSQICLDLLGKQKYHHRILEGGQVVRRLITMCLAFANGNIGDHGFAGIDQCYKCDQFRRAVSANILICGRKVTQINLGIVTSDASTSSLIGQIRVYICQTNKQRTVSIITHFLDTFSSQNLLVKQKYLHFLEGGRYLGAL